MSAEVMSTQDSGAEAETGEAASTGLSALSRRGFLATTIGSCVAFGFPSSATGSLVENPLPSAGGGQSPVPGPQFDPTIWYSIDGGGNVTFNTPNAEMGQHIGTALSRALAEELEVDWARITVVHVDTNPKWGEMMTGGSYSVFSDFKPVSQLGAAGRMALVKAGAGLLGVAPEACTASKGFVISGDRKLSYGDIVRSGRLKSVSFTKEQVSNLPLKPPSQRTVVGKSAPAWDIKSKTNGTAVYGIDAEVPGMAFACPIIPPTRYDSTVVSVDDRPAKDVKGYLRYVIVEDPSQSVPGWVVVVAETYYAAMVAAGRIQVQWRNGPAVNVSEQDFLDYAHKSIADPNQGAIVKGPDNDSRAAFAQAASIFEKTYTTGTVLHVQMEPLNALAFEKDGIFEIHTGSQWQSLALTFLSKALQRPQSSIVMRTYSLGGGFGRRLNPDYMIAAALVAKALNRPVKLVFTREADVRFDSPRAPTVQRLRLALDGGKNIQGMDFSISAGWPSAWSGSKDLATGSRGRSYDMFMIGGADHWYSVGPNTVRPLSNDLINKTIRPGWLRAVGAGWTTFALESFIDEAAHELGKNPYDFRLALLQPTGRNVSKAPEAVGGAARQANVLKVLASKFDLKATMPPDTAIGIATACGQERTMPTWIACAVQLHVNRVTGDVTVQKMHLVVDAGTVVDPDGGLAQLQGAALWGLSLALFEGTDVVNGQVRATNFHMYSPLRINKVPELKIDFVESTEAPMGLGEPGLIAVAPAIANAIYNAVGIRMRHIPIRPEDVRAALAEADKKKSS